MQKSRRWGVTLEDEYKAKVNRADHRYYTIKANFSYLNQYSLKVEAEIGRGGYGVVYKAQDTSSSVKTPYALKMNFGTVARELIFS